ncbi:MAG: flagellar motor switch protein FliN [Desulfobacterales bacterium]|nr:flagellar motor switch protein FliN [Desulfobacterales bacterium]
MSVLSQEDINNVTSGKDTTTTGQEDDTTKIPLATNIGKTASTNLSDLDRDLGFILDIPLQISVELGRTSMLISDLLRLGQGSVVELRKPAGEPMEIFVNGKLFARGEAVVVNEKFGVRLSEVIAPGERIKTLG